MTIESSARELLGVRWKHQGRDPAVGVDCVGLGVYAAERNGYQVQDRSDYGQDPDGTLEQELTRVFGAPVSRNGNDCLPSDIVMMEFAKGQPRHVGIVGSHPHGRTLIHACNHNGRVVESIMDDRWFKRIVGVWRPA